MGDALHELPGIGSKELSLEPLLKPFVDVPNEAVLLKQLS